MVTRTAIVIPNLNGAQFLGAAIESALANGPEFIVVADNGSSDNSWWIAQEYQRACPERITMVSESRRGTGRAKNAGVAAARDLRATHVMVLDSDNWLETGCLRACLEAAETEVTLVAQGVIFEGVGNIDWCPESATQMPDEPITVARLLKQNRLFCSTLFPICAWNDLGGFDTRQGFIYDDWDFWIRAAAVGYPFETVPRPLLHVRLHAGQETVKIDEAGRGRQLAYLNAKHADLIALHSHEL